MNASDRTDHSPQDPSFRWRGPSTDLRDRPTPEQCDEIRRTAKAHNAGLTGAVETAVMPARDEVAMLAYGAGVSRILAARVVALEARVAALEAKPKA
jgi:hypothetical protein